MSFRPDPKTYYSEYELRIMGLDGETLRAAVDRRQLRCKDAGSGRWFKGAWLIAWLDGEDTPGGEEEPRIDRPADTEQAAPPTPPARKHGHPGMIRLDGED